MPPNNRPPTLARSRTIRHPTGVHLNLPLLVPSFSSCADLAPSELVSVTTRDLVEGTCEQLTESFLVSAYDIAHNNVPDPNELGATPRLTMVDSGGFEALARSRRPSEGDRDRPWCADSYREVIAKWPARFPAAFVSFDSPHLRMSYEEQIARALELLGPHRSQMSILLLKPQSLQECGLGPVIDRICKDPGELRHFDIIGATEKELGTSLDDRMASIARLRLALNDSSIPAPIHVFGGLDPLSSHAYFLAGAEIFDGLSWLRYGYYRGLALYYQNYWMLSADGVPSDSSAYERMILSNLWYLSKMRNEMRRYTIDYSFDRLESVRDYRNALERAFDMLKTRSDLKGRL